jgi:hypothetical protein
LRREEEAKEAKRRGCVRKHAALFFFFFRSRWRENPKTPASPVAAALLEAHAEENGEERAREALDGGATIRENEENKANEEELFDALLSM